MINEKQVFITGIREVIPTAEQDFEPFVTLELTSKAVRVSQSTGKPYMTDVKASMSTTFSKQVAEQLIGSYLPGEIVEVPLHEDDYREWTNPRTGEVVTITTERIFKPA